MIGDSRGRARWLSEMSRDIGLIQVGLWKVEGHVVSGFTKVYPTLKIAKFTLAPARIRSLRSLSAPTGTDSATSKNLQLDTA
ncbi:hypothetical protein AB0C61_32095 [Streptomyces sp. NPDC048680]|uniref:hypothetical protein n=1 Tax=Streptomyces sp. NPDC048680 TaxID=3155492 RepID=UPI00343C9D05